MKKKYMRGSGRRTTGRSRAATVALLALAALGVAVLAVGDGVTAHAQTGGTPVNVNAFRCIALQGGNFTVPAGSTPVIRSGWTTSTQGGVRSFIEAQTTLLSVADGPMIDASGDYSEAVPGQAGWVSLLHRSTGVTLASPGDLVRFTFALVFDRNVTDVFDFDGDGSSDPVGTGRGLSFGGTCTVTAT